MHPLNPFYLKMILNRLIYLTIQKHLFSLKANLNKSLNKYLYVIIAIVKKRIEDEKINIKRIFKRDRIRKPI